MKRVLTFLALMLLPMSLMAMTSVSDSTLSGVTGQAGVNINADITMDIEIGTMAWGDSDGIAVTPLTPWDPSASGGYIGVKGFNINDLRIRARTETGDMYNGYKTVFLKPITIDVATGATLTSTNTTYVRFGLGALQISMEQLQFTVALGAHNNFNTNNDLVLNREMGVVTLGAMDIYINPWSYVDIYSHAGQGVNFDFSVTLDRVEMPFMSWGDTDGLPGGQTGNMPSGTPWMTGISAGYVGLNNFQIGDVNHAAVKITGAVAIDVATAAHGVYPDLQNFMTTMMDAGPALADFAQSLGQPIPDYDYTSQASANSLIAVMEYLGHGVANKTLEQIITDLYGVKTNGITYTTWTGTHTEYTTNVVSTAYGTDTTEVLTTYSTGTALTTATASANPLATVNVPQYTEVVPITAVHISFPANFTIEVAKMTADVVLGNRSDFGNLVPAGAVTSELGDIYIQGLKVTIQNGSWVDIWAH